MMKNTRTCFTTFLLGFFFLSASSCFQKFYKTNSISQPPEDKLALAQSDRKIVIVHFYDTIIQLKDVVVKHDTIWGSPIMLTVKERYMNSSPDKPNLFYTDDTDQVLSQIHLYVYERMPANNEILFFESAKIARFDIYDLDEKEIRKSKNASIVGIIVAGVATLLVLLGILAATLEHYL